MIGAIEVATAAVAFLSPFLPRLKDAAATAAGKLAGTVAEKGGEAAWDTAQALWKKLAARWGDDPEVKGAADMLAAKPEREDRRASFAEILAEKLETEPALLEEIKTLLGGERRVQEVAAGDRAVLERVRQQMTGAGEQTIRLGADARGSDLNQVMN